MPFVVPLLRLAYMFLNVFETYKTLKLPPPSARNGGQPSARSMTARKRAMKGCMTVWLVWCCFTMYERTLDGIVGLFVPFYDQLKTLIILFFILTRARGSEPIYLHILRPCLKPYAATLDVVMDLTHNVGDFVILLLSIPVQYVSELYQSFRSPRGKPHPAPDPRPAPTSRNSADARRPTTHSKVSSSSQVPSINSVNSAGTSARPVLRSRDPSRSSRTLSTIPRRPSNGRTSTGGSSGSSGLNKRVTGAQQHRPSQKTPVFEIWHPPASSRDDDVIVPPSGLPTPPSERQYTIPETPLREAAAEVDEWRQYPPFPSAYPPTPLPSASTLPANGSTAAPSPAASVGETTFDGIPEEHIDEDSMQLHINEPDATESPLPPRELQTPDSDGEMSDGLDSMEGIQPGHLYSDDDMDGDDEDDFDVTLRTPNAKQRPAIQKVLKPSTSGESLASRSTGLSTADDGSTLRTRSSGEETSTTLSVSDAASITGRKRRLPRATPADILRERTNPSGSKTRITRSAVSRNVATLRVRGPQPKDSGVTDDENLQTASDGSDDEFGIKRRRVPEAAAGFVPRPPARKEDSDRTIRGRRGAKFEVERRPRLHQPSVPKSRSDTRVPTSQGSLPTRSARTTATARPVARSQSTSGVAANKRKPAAVAAERNTREMQRS